MAFVWPQNGYVYRTCATWNYYIFLIPGDYLYTCFSLLILSADLHPISIYFLIFFFFSNVLSSLSHPSVLYSSLLLLSTLPIFLGLWGLMPVTPSIAIKYFCQQFHAVALMCKGERICFWPADTLALLLEKSHYNLEGRYSWICLS